MFRAQVFQAYQNRCAISDEPIHLVLQAAHIKPYSKGGFHSVNNGLLLRSDFRTLFDKGYITIRCDDYTLKVSQALSGYSADASPYEIHDGKQIRLPQDPSLHPDPKILKWHNKNIFIAD